MSKHNLKNILKNFNFWYFSTMFFYWFLPFWATGGDRRSYKFYWNSPNVRHTHYGLIRKGKEERKNPTKSQYIILLVKDYKEIIWKDKPHRNGGFIISLKILIGMWHHHQTSIMWRRWFQIKELDQGFSKYKMKYIWEKEKLMKIHFQSLLSFIIRFYWFKN